LIYDFKICSVDLAVYMSAISSFVFDGHTLKPSLQCNSDPRETRCF